MLAVRMRTTPSSVRPRPMIRRPPTPLTSRTFGSVCGSASKPPSSPADRLSAPWTTMTVTAANRTPKPKVAASTMLETPSRAAFRSRNESSPLRPFWMEPTRVSGPTQNSRLAAVKPSVKRPCPPKRFFSHVPAASRPSSMRHHSPRTPPAARATRPRMRPGGLATSVRSKALLIPMNTVTRPIACMTVVTMRSPRRPRRSRPSREPATTVTVLTSVPDVCSRMVTSGSLCFSAALFAVLFVLGAAHGQDGDEHSGGKRQTDQPDEPGAEAGRADGRRRENEALFAEFPAAELEDQLRDGIFLRECGVPHDHLISSGGWQLHVDGVIAAGPGFRDGVPVPVALGQVHFDLPGLHLFRGGGRLVGRFLPAGDLVGAHLPEFHGDGGVFDGRAHRVHHVELQREARFRIGRDGFGRQLTENEGGVRQRGGGHEEQQRKKRGKSFHAPDFTSHPPGASGCRSVPRISIGCPRSQTPKAAKAIMNSRIGQNARAPRLPKSRRAMRTPAYMASSAHRLVMAAVMVNSQWLGTSWDRPQSGV